MLILISLLPVEWCLYHSYRFCSDYFPLAQQPLAKAISLLTPSKFTKTNPIIYRNKIFGINPRNKNYPCYFSFQNGTSYRDSDLCLLRDHHIIDLIFEKNNSPIMECRNSKTNLPQVNNSLCHIRINKQKNIPYYIPFKTDLQQKGLIYIKEVDQNKIVTDIVLLASNSL